VGRHPCIQQTLYQMDPLTAVSLAGNIVQFVDFASKLISGARTLYNGEAAENVEIQTLTKDIRTLAEKTRPPDNPQRLLEENDVTLKILSDQCIALSDELLSMLQSLKTTSEHNVLESFYRALKSEWKRKDIKALQQRLDRVSIQLGTHSTARRHDDVIRRLDDLAAQNELLMVNRTKEITKLKTDVEDVFRHFTNDSEHEGAKNRMWLELATMAQQGNQLSTEQFILGQLRFDTMRDRYVAIHEAHTKTFSWILEPELRASTSPNTTEHPRFLKWLTSSESSLYWVSGKPGSGKSTLMKYLCTSPLTLTELRTWSSDCKLVTANFFFWNAAKHPLQKSQEGLLRSVLYQILRQCPELIQPTFPDQYLFSDLLAEDAIKALYFLRFLTVSGLLAAFKRMSKAVTLCKIKFCFFIDGLDEFDGKPKHLVQLLDIFKISHNVKMCVSSRPWIEFEVPFGQQNTWKLYVHELTKDDIWLYVKDCLESNHDFQALKLVDDRYLAFIEDIVTSAQGVFLWVFLVVQSLLDGLTNADRIVDLQQRLEALPRDLDEYFEKILFNVDPFYRQQAARMCLVTLQASDVLPLMVYWFIDQEVSCFINPVQPMDDVQLGLRLDQMKKRLITLGKCLLEAQAPRYLPRDHEVANVLFSWNVHFLHRTVRDFLQTPRIFQSLNRWAGEDFNVDMAISEAIMAEIKIVPYDPDYFAPDRLQKLVTVFLNHVVSLEGAESFTEERCQVLDEIHKHIQLSSPFHRNSWTSLFTSQALFSLHDRAELQPMLAIAAERGLLSYVFLKMDQASDTSHRSSGYLLESVLLSSRYRGDSDRLKMLRLLLERGVSPNASVLWYTTGTCWSRYLQQVRGVKESVTYIDFAMIKEMLAHGADPEAKCFSTMNAKDVLCTKLTASQFEDIKRVIEKAKQKLIKHDKHKSFRAFFSKSKG
jgi:hypothetical protein